MISIEAFPLISIQNVPDVKPKMGMPSAGSDGDSFSGLVRGLNPERSSLRSPSGEAGKSKDLKKGKDDYPSLLGDPAATARLVDSKKNILSHPALHSGQQNGEMAQHYVGQGQIGETSPVNGVQSVLGTILSQPGFTQEAINNSEQLKEILTKLGLDADQVADLLEMKSATVQGEGKEAFLARLLGALEEKGMLPEQAKEVSEMLAAVKVQGDSGLSTGVKQDSVMRDLLVQLGMGPGEAQKAVKAGELSLGELKEILTQLGMGSEEVHEAVQGEKVLLGDLKNVLLQLGVKTGNLNALIDAGEGGGSELFPKGWLEMFDKAMNNDITANSLTPALQGDLPAGNGNSGGQDSTGNGDLQGEGQLAVGSIGDKAVTSAGEARGDFEQMMSRISSRGPLAQKVMEQIVEGARIQVANGQTKAKILLQPPDLGKINLHIVTKEDQVKVTFFAETTQVKEIIETNLSQLRQSFVQQGLRVDNFDVFVDYHSSGNPAEQHNPFSAFNAHGSENGGLEYDEGMGEGMARQWVSGNHTIDFFA